MSPLFFIWFFEFLSSLHWTMTFRVMSKILRGFNAVYGSLYYDTYRSLVGLIFFLGLEIIYLFWFLLFFFIKKRNKFIEHRLSRFFVPLFSAFVYQKQPLSYIVSSFSLFFLLLGLLVMRILFLLAFPGLLYN